MSEGLEQEIRAQRTESYGDHTAGHRNLGLIWTGLLQNHYGITLPYALPAGLVEIMMAANKLNRIAVNPSGPDHYADGRIYLQLAYESQLKEELDAKSAT